jgi:hypothetical protein
VLVRSEIYNFTQLQLELRMKSDQVMAMVVGAFVCALAASAAQAQIIGDPRLKERADAIVGLMSFMLTPDVTTGSLSLNDDAAGNPDIALSTLGGGFTISQDVPLYLEGTMGYSRYDPAFLASDGEVERPIPTRWNNISATGGIGWDFPLAANLTLRPMFNFSLGSVKTDIEIAGWYLENQTEKDPDLEFLNDSDHEVYGLGGSLILDYEHYLAASEVDTEIRYTNITLQSYSDAPEAVDGSSVSQSLSLWARWRKPTGITALKKPLRYVLEGAHTSFIGDMRGALGFDALNSLGVGLELDSSAYGIFTTRWRLMLRYRFGDNVKGYGVGLAVSF